MTVRYIKAAPRPENQNSPELSAQVAELLDSLRTGGEPRALEMAAEYDRWHGPIVVDRATIDQARSNLDPLVLADIEAAHRNIATFAEAQRRSLAPVTVEVAPGIWAGHRLMPVEVAGCYIPAGRFAHVASALMSVTTASVAGVNKVIAASPARDERGGVHPAVLVAADLAGADVIVGLGGVQAIGALAYGLFTGHRADMIVGPGNALVAEAKRQLFGRVGIDVVAGPTESMIVADETADPATVAADLVGQAEHGVDSPVWLVTTSEELGRAVAELVPIVAGRLPHPASEWATTAWERHGEIIVVDDRHEAVEVCDDYAPEHLQVLAADLDWWLDNLGAYGSLFLGPETTVTFGDKSSGPNHILPTGRAARYSGGLNVLSFLRTPTWQQMTPQAGSGQAALAARIARLEGMEGHARSADLRGDDRGALDEGTADLRGDDRGALDEGTADLRADDRGALDEGTAVLVGSGSGLGSQGLPTVVLDFTAQDPIPPAGVARVNELMKTGQLFRYGETTTGPADAARLEAEFATLVGSRYCVALNSCGAALAVALMAAGVERDEPVMVNAFTLAPVPGAIAHAAAEPVFVGITPEYHIDLADLRAAVDRTGSRWLVLSYMRGHIPDLDGLFRVCEELGVCVIEDCAHTMGAGWRGRPTGTFGVAGCFSTQSFKHVNSGEGGLLVTDNADLAARAVLMSGSYMLYEQHGARPDTDVFERHRLHTPNFSMRMSGLAAALARSQLGELDLRARRWNRRYRELAERLDADPRMTVPARHRDENYVASSIQFSVDRAAVDSDTMIRWLDIAAAHGVAVKWFGRPEPVGFTSRFDHWRYAPEPSLDRTQQVLAGLCDIRIPLSMTSDDVGAISTVLRASLDLALGG